MLYEAARRVAQETLHVHMPEANTTNILVLHGKGEGCWAHHGEDGSRAMQAWRGRDEVEHTGKGFAWCREGDKQLRRFHVYVVDVS